MRPYCLVSIRRSKMTTTPRSLLERMSRPKPCRNLSTASGTVYSSKGRSNCSARAATIGSDGTSKGSLTMTSTESASPGTSTPSQKLLVPSSTPPSELLNEASSVERDADGLGRLLELGVGGEQHKRAAPRGRAQFDEAMLDRFLVSGPVHRLGDVVDKVEQGGSLVVEGRADGHLVRLVGVQAAFDVVEVARRRQRGGGHHDRLLRVPQVFLHQRADVQRRGAERGALAVGLHLRPVDRQRVGLEDQAGDFLDDVVAAAARRVRRPH